MQPKGAAKRRQAEHVADSFSDEQFWHWISMGNEGPKTSRQQRKGMPAAQIWYEHIAGATHRSTCFAVAEPILKLFAAWRAWIKQCQEEQNHTKQHQSANSYTASHAGQKSRNARQADKQYEKQSSNFDWQQFDTFHSNMFRSWEFKFRAAFTDQSQGSRSEKQKERRSKHDLHQAQQQQCMQTLGLPRTSVLDAAILRSAFHDCAKKWHPDRHVDSAKRAAESKFKEAQAAYQHLLTCL